MRKREEREEGEEVREKKKRTTKSDEAEPKREADDGAMNRGEAGHSSSSRAPLPPDAIEFYGHDASHLSMSRCEKGTGRKAKGARAEEEEEQRIIRRRQVEDGR